MLPATWMVWAVTSGATPAICASRNRPSSHGPQRRIAAREIMPAPRASARRAMRRPSFRVRSCSAGRRRTHALLRLEVIGVTGIAVLAQLRREAFEGIVLVGVAHV